MEIPKDTCGLPICLMNLSLDPQGLDGTLPSQKLSLTRPIPDPPKKITLTRSFCSSHAEAPEPNHTAWGQQWGKSCLSQLSSDICSIVLTFHVKRMVYAFMGGVEERELGGNAF